jgi:MFS family permease
LVGTLLSFFQQFSGINAIMFYSNVIFAMVGVLDPTVATILVGIVNMVATLSSTILLSYFGRKKLLWIISFLMAATLIGLGVCYNHNNNPRMVNHTIGVFEIALVLLFVVLFAFSLGPITWIYMSEVMTEKGVTIGTLVNWIGTILMALFTPPLLMFAHGYMFIGFGVICAVCGLFSLLVVKETKGLTNKQVTTLYSK